MYDITIPDKFPTHGDIKKKRIKEYLDLTSFTIFVETGTYKGNGVSWSLENGFNNVYSTEIFKPLYEECVERFKNNSNIYLYNLDTVDFLNNIVPSLKTKTVFFLDAHISGGDSSHNPNYPVPLLQECEIIKQKFYNLNDSIIIIDDERLWDTNLKQTLKNMFNETAFKTLYLDDEMIFCNNDFIKNVL